MGQSLSRAEVSDLTGLSPSWVNKHDAELRGPDGDYDLAKLSPDAQLAWANGACQAL